MDIETTNYGNNVEIKQNILNYMMGKVNFETGYNQPFFNDEGFSEGTIKGRILERAQEKEIKKVAEVLLLGKIYDEALTNWLVYGFYNLGEYNEETGYNNSVGYIYIMDNNLNEVALLTEFDSGTKLFPIVALNKDEDNNYYGLTWNITTDDTRRVILLNNILSSGQTDGNYIIKLRKSYIIPTDCSLFMYRQNRITKVRGEGIYYIVGHATSSQAELKSATRIIKFEINVGSENTWETYILDELVDTMRFSVLIDKIDGETTFRFYGVTVEANSSTYKEYSLTGGKLTKVKSIPLNNHLDAFGSQVFIKDSNNIYISAESLSENKTILYKLNNGNFVRLWSRDWNPEVDAEGNEIYYVVRLTLELINNVIFFKITNYNSTSTDISIGLLQNDVMYEKYLHENDTKAVSFYDYIDFYVTNNYNLYNIFVTRENAQIYTPSMVKLNLIYNPLNYNGYKYSNDNLLIPNSAVLYNDFNVPIFARNLYNKIVSDNSTVSTVQIPNTLCNNQKIALSTLMSETNMPVASDTKNIIKNIYENVYLNFINLINIINNNGDDSIFNSKASAKLNYAINTSSEYNNIKLTKYRINYADGTNTVSSFELNQELDFSNKYILTLLFYLDKKSNNLEFISNDEQTVYCTIDLSNYEINKLYSLKQRVRIGGENERRRQKNKNNI